MRTSIAVTFLAMSFFTPAAPADDNPDVEGLWTRWQSGDGEAFVTLQELGPEARVLAHRILYAEGAVFPKSPEGDTWFLLRSMQADLLPELVKAIDRSINDNERIGLIELLPDNPMSLPADDVLLDIAVEESGKLREAALTALAHAQGKRDYLIPELIRLAKRSDADRTAGFAVSLLGECADERARIVLTSIAHFHPAAQVRQLAIVALVKKAKRPDWVSRTLIEALDDGSSTGTGAFGSGSVAGTAMDVLLTYRELPPDDAIALIIKLYRQSFEKRTVWAYDLCEAICRCPTTDEHAAELVDNKLRPLLEPDAYIRDEADEIRIAAACVVLKWHPEDRAAADHLVAVLSDATDGDFSFYLGGRIPDIRAQAARGFERIGPAARDHLPLLHEVMERELQRHPHSELTFATAWAIAHIDPDDTKCMRVLKHADDEWRNRRYLSWEQVALVLGTRAKLLTDLAELLPSMHDPEFLLEHTGSDQEWFWQSLRPHAAEVVPAIAQHFASDRIDVRVAAAEALGFLRANADTAVPQLIERLRDPRAVVRAAAAEALGDYGTAASGAIPALKAAAEDDYLTVQYRVREALAAIEPN